MFLKYSENSLTNKQMLTFGNVDGVNERATRFQPKSTMLD